MKCKLSIDTSHFIVPSVVYIVIKSHGDRIEIDHEKDLGVWISNIYVSAACYKFHS